MVYIKKKNNNKGYHSENVTMIPWTIVDNIEYCSHMKTR